MRKFRPEDALLLRWLAIAGAGGAAVAAALGYYYTNPVWQIVGFAAAMMAIAGIAGLWRAVYKRSIALVEAVVETGDQMKSLCVS